MKIEPQNEMDLPSAGHQSMRSVDPGNVANLGPVSWKAEVMVDRKWASNGLRFASKTGAQLHASGLYQSWTLTTDHRVVPSDDPVSIGSSTVAECDAYDLRIVGQCESCGKDLRRYDFGSRGDGPATQTELGMFCNDLCEDDADVAVYVDEVKPGTRGPISSDADGAL